MMLKELLYNFSRSPVSICKPPTPGLSLSNGKGPRYWCWRLLQAQWDQQTFSAPWMWKLHVKKHGKIRKNHHLHVYWMCQISSKSSHSEDFGNTSHSNPISLSSRFDLSKNRESSCLACLGQGALEVCKELLVSLSMAGVNRKCQNRLGFFEIPLEFLEFGPPCLYK